MRIIDPGFEYIGYGYIVTILITVLFRKKLRLVALCPILPFLGYVATIIFSYTTNDNITLAPSLLLTIFLMSITAGLFLTALSLLIIYAIKNHYQSKQLKKFSIAIILVVLIYIASYLVISRNGMKISEQGGFEGYYVTSPEPTDTWHFLHYSYFQFYCIPIWIEDKLGTAVFAWNPPTMQIYMDGRLIPEYY